MVNLYRFCIAILFASLSFSLASMCQQNNQSKIDSVVASYNSKSGRVKTNVGNGSTGYIDYPATCNPLSDICYETRSQQINDLSVRIYYAPVVNRGPYNPPDKIVQPTIVTLQKCDDETDPTDPTKPDLGDWANCKKGKDHGFSWITIGDGNGEGESRFKQEFWACDDPDIWIVYNHPPEDKPTDPDPKPTDPDNPDPKPTDPDGEGGEGGDNGSGNGNDGGSNGGNDNGSNNGGDQNGTGLTKGEVQEAVEGALDSKGQELEGKINKWWLTTQAEMENEGRTMGHAADQLFDNALGNLVADRDIKEFEREYRFELPASKQCPAPIPIKIDFLGIDIQFEFTLICEFLEMIGLLVLASAYITAIYIMLGLRRG